MLSGLAPNHQQLFRCFSTPKTLNNSPNRMLKEQRKRKTKKFILMFSIKSPIISTYRCYTPSNSITMTN